MEKVKSADGSVDHSELCQCGDPRWKHLHDEACRNQACSCTVFKPMKKEEVDKSLAYDRTTGRWLKKMAEMVAEAGRTEDYERYFMKNLGKTGFTSITDMPKDKRRKFFSVVNKGWKSKEEKRKAASTKAEQPTTKEQAGFPTSGFGHIAKLWKFSKPPVNKPQEEGAADYATELGPQDVIDEKAPPGFPKKLYHKIKKQYQGNPEAAYGTMWKVHQAMKEVTLDEVAPPGFPKKIYKNVKAQYPGEPEKAYATMWKIHNQMKEQWEDVPQQQNAPKPASTEPRSLSQIASDIYRDWKNVNYAAKPYLSAMRSLNSINDMYGADPGSMIVAYFLSNAASWKGPVAKQIKLELNKMLKSAKHEELDETSTSGGAGAYSTPFAFSGGLSGNEKRRKNTAIVGTGYKLAKGDE